MKTLVVALLAGFLLVLPGSGAAHAKTCDLPAYPSASGRYVDGITAKHLSCDDAYKLMTKHYQCRIKNGPAGRCVKLVMHFGCREERFSDFYGGFFTSYVTCKHDRKTVKWAFEQSSTVA